MYGIVESHAQHVYDAARRRRAQSLEGLLERVGPTPPCDEQIDRRRLLARAEEATATGDDVGALFETIVEGNSDDTRADYAEAREWTPERVKNAREKMKRRLAAAGLRKGDDDDDEGESG
jgi:hypothetical protein